MYMHININIYICMNVHTQNVLKYKRDNNGWVSFRFPTVCTTQIHDPRVMNM